MASSDSDSSGPPMPTRFPASSRPHRRQMESSDSDSSASPMPAQFPASSLPSDTILLHVLSPSPEVNGGRITFPSIPLDTNISRLKSRIQKSMMVSLQPERQRLIYRGRPLLNMNATLREVLQPELNTSTDDNPSYTLHLVISPAAGPMPPAPTPTFRQNAPQHRSTPLSGPQASQALPNAPQAAHHQHAPHFPPPTHATMAQAQAPQVMWQNQLSQLQQQIAMNNLMTHGLGGHGHGHGPGHVHNQPPQMPPFPSTLPNMQALQAAIMQQQQMRAHAGMHGIHNPGMNGALPGMAPGMALGQNNQALGPITTRVHETVGPDGQRTRVVVNETTFQISRQPTPISGANRPEVHHASESQNLDTNPAGSQPRRQHEPIPLPSQQLPFPYPPVFPNERQGYPPTLPSYVPPTPAYQPIIPDPNRDTAITTTTAWLLSSPNGPQALVFAPGHGLFTSAPSTAQPSVRAAGPRIGLRLHQTANGRLRPQNAANIPAPPILNPAVANAQPQPALEAIARARNAAAAARQANAEVNANNEVLRTILSRVWTFIKLYFVIFMFTEPGTWFRWLCLLGAVLVSAVPSTTVFRGFQARLQAEIDGLVGPPPPPPVPAQAQQQIEAAAAGAGGAARRPPEPDPAVTAARLVREHRERHPNVLRDTFERIERALGLFVASLIPGVGERQVRAREEARREIERERLERERVAAEEEEARKKKEEAEEKEKKQEAESAVGEGQSSKMAMEHAQAESVGEKERERERERGLIEI